MNFAVRLVSGGGVGVALATAVGLVDADAVGLEVAGVKLLSSFLHPVTKSGTTDRNTNKQRRIKRRLVAAEAYHSRLLAQLLQSVFLYYPIERLSYGSIRSSETD